MEIDWDSDEMIKASHIARPPPNDNQIFATKGAAIQVVLEKSTIATTAPFILLKTLIEQLNSHHPLTCLKQEKLVLSALEKKGILIQVENITDRLARTRYFFTRDNDGVRNFEEFVDNDYLLQTKYKSTEVWAMVQKGEHQTLPVFMCRLMAKKRPTDSMELRELGDELDTKLPNPPKAITRPFIRGQIRSNQGQPDQIAGRRIHEAMRRHAARKGPYNNYIIPVDWPENSEEMMDYSEETESAFSTDATESIEDIDGWQ